ncbi:UNVERIFIED_CONTAM: hypothetical protein PYX00_002174 [Menopon gallinae]|uniref:COMM domain-containing protein n=1 Tax=Menopon gallinae TaxID=328185 RepID=A0AAW2IFX5_9NEOP
MYLAKKIITYFFSANCICTHCNCIFHTFSFLQLNEELFREVLISLGFKEELVETIYKEYLSCTSLLNQALPQTSLTFPQFSNLEWRFEAQVSSKSIKNEISPRIVMKLELEKRNKIENICIQSDIPNLLHMSMVLNQALEESRTNHSRRMRRAVT